MRKVLIVSLIILVLLTALGAGAAVAQDKIPLEMGQWVSGTISDTAYEVKYTISAKKDQLIMLEMVPKPGTYDLDPDVLIRNSDGDVLAQNDDFSYPLSIALLQIPADGTYTVLATRSGGKGGSSTGDYLIRASSVEPLKPGTKQDVTITSNYDKDIPNDFVIAPASDGPVKIGFSQKAGDLFASLQISEWIDDSYPNTVLGMTDTAGVTAATFSVNLKSGTYYILTIGRSSDSYQTTDETATVTFTMN